MDVFAAPGDPNVALQFSEDIAGWNAIADNSGFEISGASILAFSSIAGDIINLVMNDVLDVGLPWTLNLPFPITFLSGHPLIVPQSGETE